MERKFSEIDWNQFTRMTVMETIAEKVAGDLVALLRDHVSQIKTLSAFVSAEILAEEGGRMVVFQVTFSSRPALMSYHASRQYRQLVAKTAPMLVGDIVSKVFHRRAIIGGPVIEGEQE